MAEPAGLKTAISIARKALGKEVFITAAAAANTELRYANALTNRAIEAVLFES